MALLVGFLLIEDSLAIDMADALFLIALEGAACLVDAAGVDFDTDFSIFAGSSRLGLVSDFFVSGIFSAIVSGFSAVIGSCPLSFVAREASFAVTLSTLSPWNAASAVRILWGDGLNGEADAVSSCLVGDTVTDL